MQAELIYNSFSGPISVLRELEAVVSYLERRGWTLSVHETYAPLEATRLAREAVQRGADVVIAAGGDGTVNEVACALVGTDVALGVLPVGSTNVWALQMRIPALTPGGPGSRLAKLVVDLEERIDYRFPLSYYRSILLAAARVLVEGDIRTVDVGLANDRHFLMWAGVGLDAAVTANVSPESKKAFGALWAFVTTAIDMARDYEGTNITLTVDGEVKQLHSPLIVASNIQLYAGILPLGARACVDDGKLDICAFRQAGLLTFVQYALKIASRQHLEDPGIDYLQGEEIIIEAEVPLPVHVDDELFGETPLTIRVVPLSLRVIVPHDAPQDLFVG